MDRKEMLARLKKGEDPLEVAIQKWQDIVEGKGKDHGGVNCALCKVHEDCEACPVFEKTKEWDCLETPYVAYRKAIEADQSDKILKAIAKKELEFLKALRKKEG